MLTNLEFPELCLSQSFHHRPRRNIGPTLHIIWAVSRKERSSAPLLKPKILDTKALSGISFDPIKATRQVDQIDLQVAELVEIDQIAAMIDHRSKAIFVLCAYSTIVR